MNKYVIYCDGACSGNPGPGAWAYVVFDIHGMQIAAASGFLEETTNNRMELKAVINALESFDDCKIVVDSKYVKDGITEWIKKWKTNGWRSTTGEVKNVDLWKKLDDLVQAKNVHFEWQRGHAGGVHDCVDVLARGSVLR